MQPQQETKPKPLINKKKPQLSSNKKINQAQSPQNILYKLQLYYKYKTASIYKQLKIPLYENQDKSKIVVNNNNNNNKIQKLQHVDNYIDILYKYVNLNSKYHHRQKMRFSRTPLFKHIKYDFASLREKLQNKNYMKMYDDLQDNFDEDDGKQKKQYFQDGQFSEESIIKYKKKNNIKGNIIVAYGYEDLKEYLISNYGWTQNKDLTSLCYTLKFMSKKKDIDNVNLLDSQYVNHFEQNKNITAKFGLCRNIKNVIGLGGNHLKYFPKCYDVNDVNELQDFYEEFKFSECIRILTDIIGGGKGCQLDKKYKNQIIMSAIAGLKKKLLPIGQKLKLIISQKPIYVTMQQWSYIKQYFQLKKKSKVTEKCKNKVQQQQKQQNITKDQDISIQILQKCKQVLNQLEKDDPQFNLNKDNIWIVKPASMSRGRGIKTFNKLEQILDYIVGKQISWVIQKYIERPLIIKKKKFDIRQWVLVTDFKPLRVWVYEQCYVRFCAEEYNTQNLKDRKIHLTNNSVTKGQNNINDGISENMMSQQQFVKHLKQRQGSNIFHEKIKPQIVTVCIQSLKSVKENIVARKNTFQIFGYDFMIDEQYNVWLIQVNSSPTMQYSTKITQKLVKDVMSDLGQIVENYMLKNKYYNGDKYGGWKLVYGK